MLALWNLATSLNTSKNTSTNAWIEWTEYVLQQGVDPEDAPSALINQGCHTVMEARKQDGKPYPLNTLSIVLCSFKTHPNYSVGMEHLYRCRIHRLSENVGCTNEEGAVLLEQCQTTL